MKAKNMLEILTIIILFQISAFESAQSLCGHDIKNNPKIKEGFINSKRNLETKDNYDLNIVFDLTNVEEGITKYKLTAYRSIIINSFTKVAQTLKTLLKVVQRKCHYIYGDDFEDYGFDNWNKAKFGITKSKNYFKNCDYNIDLFILSRFYNSDELIEYSNTNLLISQILYVSSTTGQPISGDILLNQKAILANINKKNLEEYFKYLLLHHLIHLLGFQKYIIENYFSSYIFQQTKNGVRRTFIKTNKVVNVAKKYFNCSDIKGVELEDQDSSIHWESRILLGEIMTVSPFEPEQVISEFTLAFLEDTGYYIANYYTGGLMQFGRNKGCKFVNEKCIQNYKVDPKYENEYYSFDNFISGKNIDASCSNARQSRTYFVKWVYNIKIPSYYQYFKNSSFGGYNYADYCPVAENYYTESDKFYYIGRCNKMGIADYGSYIQYIDNLKYTNGDLEEKTGETYSENSYCYQSSLYKDNEPKKYYYSNTVRAICYESFCSSKSLTIKIHDNYIVCPRQGGKITAIGFVGYFLCPDYYLICSGKVLCNDMFDCVTKKSEIKSESYYRDYEPKTSQNLVRAESEEIDNENNYELTNDGICPLHCKQCSGNKKCFKCRNNWALLGNKENNEVVCIHASLLYIGYYKDENTSIYYRCGENCRKCLNDLNCITCNINYAKINNSNNSCFSIDELIPYYIKDPKDESNYLRCNQVYNHCLTCNDMKCLSCENGYTYTDDTFKECKRNILSSSYLDNNIEEDEEENHENNNFETKKEEEYFEEIKENNEDYYLKEENENIETYEENKEQEYYKENKEKNTEEVNEANEVEYNERKKTNREIYEENNEEEYYNNNKENNEEIFKEEFYNDNKENIEENNVGEYYNNNKENNEEIYEEEYYNDNKENIEENNEGEYYNNNKENNKEIYEENKEEEYYNDNKENNKEIYEENNEGEYYFDNKENNEKNIEENNEGEYYNENKETNKEIYEENDEENKEEEYYNNIKETNKEIYQENSEEEYYNDNKETNKEIYEENDEENKEEEYYNNIKETNKEIYQENSEEEYKENNKEIYEEHNEEEYYQENKEKNKEIYEENREVEEEYYQENKEKNKEINEEIGEENREEGYKENIIDENISEDIENTGENLIENEIYEENEEKNSEENIKENYYNFPEKEYSNFMEEETDLKHFESNIEYLVEENKENSEETNASDENIEIIEEDRKEKYKDEEGETKENTENNFERQFETFEFNEYEKHIELSSELFEKEINIENEIMEKINTIEEFLEKQEKEFSGENEINREEINSNQKSEENSEGSEEDFEKEENEEDNDEDVNSTQNEIDLSNNEISTNYILENTSYSSNQNYESQNITNDYNVKTDSNIIYQHSYYIFIFQAILKDNQIHLFIISEPKTQGIKYLILKVIVEKNNRLRNLNQQETILKAIKNNNSFNRIEDYSTNLENLNITGDTTIQIQNITVEPNDNANDNTYVINYPGNMDNLNTKKVQTLISNGEINFFDKYLDSNYKINLYKIQQSSTGCEFDLITNNEITRDKNIKLSFTEVQKASNTIDIDCNLASNNSNIIKCKTNQKLNNLYFINDYKYYDNNELIILFNDDKTINYNLLCEEDSFNSDKAQIPTTDIYKVEPLPNTEEPIKINQYNKNSGSNSTGMIVGVIVGIIVLGSIIFASICIYKKCRKKNKVIKVVAQPVETENTTNYMNNTIHSVNVTKNQNDSNKKKFIFKTTHCYEKEVFIDPNKTLNDLIKLYFESVKYPELFGDKEIRFVMGANEIDRDSKELISYFMLKNCINKLFVMVVDANQKLLKKN